MRGLECIVIAGSGNFLAFQ